MEMFHGTQLKRGEFNLTNKEQLLDFVNKNDNIIIFGAGFCGELIARFLVEVGKADKIFCIVVSEKQGNPEHVVGIPVLDISDVTQYAESSPVIIATFEASHVEIKYVLNENGFKNIITMKDVCYAQIRKTLTGLPSGSSMIAAHLILNSLESKIANLESRITEQLEVVAVNTTAFKNYRNLHAGKEVVVMGAGASLDHYSPIESAIHIGVNTTYRFEKVKLDYFFAQDFYRKDFLSRGEHVLRDYINDITHLECKKFIGRYMYGTFEQRHRQISESDFLNMNATEYFIDAVPSRNIHQNICFHPLMDFHSVIFSAIHFALFTNPKVIYLVGCDVSDGGYFSKAHKSTLSSEWIDSVKTGYCKVKEFAERIYPKTEIVSINPVGLRGLFRDVYI